MSHMFGGDRVTTAKWDQLWDDDLSEDNINILLRYYRRVNLQPDDFRVPAHLVRYDNQPRPDRKVADRVYIEHVLQVGNSREAKVRTMESFIQYQCVLPVLPVQVKLARLSRRAVSRRRRDLVVLSSDWADIADALRTARVNLHDNISNEHYGREWRYSQWPHPTIAGRVRSMNAAVVEVGYMNDRWYVAELNRARDAIKDLLPAPPSKFWLSDEMLPNTYWGTTPHRLEDIEYYIAKYKARRPTGRMGQDLEVREALLTEYFEGVRQMELAAEQKMRRRRNALVRWQKGRPEECVEEDINNLIALYEAQEVTYTDIIGDVREDDVFRTMVEAMAASRLMETFGFPIENYIELQNMKIRVLHNIMYPGTGDKFKVDGDTGDDCPLLVSHYLWLHRKNRIIPGEKVEKKVKVEPTVIHRTVYPEGEWTNHNSNVIDLTLDEEEETKLDTIHDPRNSLGDHEFLVWMEAQREEEEEEEEEEEWFPQSRKRHKNTRTLQSKRRRGPNRK